MPAHPRRLTPKDVLGMPLLHSDPQIDPSGACIAYVRAEVAREKTKLVKRNIWVVNTDGTRERKFTCGPRADFHPRWSPDGARLAFLSDRLEDGKLQVYCMDRDGGEAQALTAVQGEIEASTGRGALQWSADGRFLSFLMRDPETAQEKKRTEAKDDACVHEEPRKFLRLWTLELATKKLTQVTRGGVQVWDYERSPDGRQFVLIISNAPFEWSWYRCRLALVPAAGGAPKTLYAPPKRQIAFPRWSPDQRQIAFLSSVWSDRGLHHGAVFVVSARGGAARCLTAEYPGGLSCMEWLRGSRSLLAAGHEEGEAAFTRIDVQTARVATLWRKPVAFSETIWPRFTVDRQQRHAAVVREGPRAPRDVWRVDLPGSGRTRLAMRQLTHTFPGVKDVALGAQELIRWKARDGWTIRGVLLKPVGYKKGRRYPTVVVLHGGPTNLVCNGFLISGQWGQVPQVLASHGYAVLLPNFRGSSGYGLKFAEANVGDMGGEDFHDIQCGVDALIERGIADPKRLGIGGWSYGGFMACWTVTQTTRYKAALMGAGVSNWLSFHGNTEIHAWDAGHYDANPYELDGVYARFSAMHHIHRVKTPTLILHGENDRCVPVEQAYQFHRGLRDHAVASELVVYPREGHAFTEKNHWLDARRRIMAWYDKYLKR